MKKIVIDLYRLKQEYLDNKKDILECAKIFGVSESVIRKRLDEMDIKKRSFTEAKIIKTNIDNSVIIDLYWNKNLSIAEVAKKIKKSENFVKTRLKQSGAGTRSISDGIKIKKKTNNIKNEEIIYLYEKKKTPLTEISKYFNKSEEFARQRLLKIDHPIKGNNREYNGSWKGGITDVRNLIRSGTLYSEWRKLIFERTLYKSEISGINDVLNCHHLIPFSKTLQTILIQNTPLLNFPNMYKECVYNNPRLYDTDNGICILETEHKLIEKYNIDGHPWWRIWMAFPKFAIDRSNLKDDDFLFFNSDGLINPVNSKLFVSSKRDINFIIKHQHYLGTIPNNSLILVSKKGNIITGIASFGKGSNKHIPKDTLELTRLCIPYYVIKPYGRTFLSMCYEYIKNNYPEIQQLISYVDPSVGHNGGIYRMSGWSKAGHTLPSYCYFDSLSCQLRHKSSCRRIKGLDKTEKEIAESKGFIKIPLPPKYKYIYSLA